MIVMFRNSDNPNNMGLFDMWIEWEAHSYVGNSKDWWKIWESI